LLDTSMLAEIVGVTEAGQNALYVGFAGVFLPAIIFFIMMLRVNEGKRKFHTTTILIQLVASLAYLVMACGYGASEVNGRQFFYARYVDWFLTTPLLLLDLCSLAYTHSDTTFLMMGCTMLMVAAGYIGAMIPPSADHYIYKRYAFFGLGCFFYLPIAFNLMFGIVSKGSRSAQFLSEYQAARETFNKMRWLTVLTWTLYPVVWYLAEGSGTISVDNEVLAYVFLDLCSKSLFGFVLLTSKGAIQDALYVTDVEETYYSNEKKPLCGPGTYKDVEAPQDRQRAGCCK